MRRWFKFAQRENDVPGYLLKRRLLMEQMCRLSVFLGGRHVAIANLSSLQFSSHIIRALRYTFPSEIFPTRNFSELVAFLNFRSDVPKLTTSTRIFLPEATSKRSGHLSLCSARARERLARYVTSSVRMNRDELPHEPRDGTRTK